MSGGKRSPGKLQNAQSSGEKAAWVSEEHDRRSTEKCEERTRPGPARARTPASAHPATRMARSQAEIQAAGRSFLGAAAGRPGRDGEDAGPTLSSLWFVNKPHSTLETLKWGPDPPLQPTKTKQPQPGRGVLSRKKLPSPPSTKTAARGQTSKTDKP